MSQLPAKPLSASSLALRSPARLGWLGRFLGPFCADIELSEEARSRLQEAYQQGTVIHTLRARRVVDPIFVQHVLQRLGLGLPDWMHDHRNSACAPSVEALLEQIKEQKPALLFLRRPKTLLSNSSSYSERHVEALVAQQRQSDTPILLVPEALLWTKKAVGLRPSIIDSIFGDREAPGVMREMLGFFWQYKSAKFHVGTPVNIKSVLERMKGQSDRTIAKKIRWTILHHLTREEQLRTGPMHRTAARTRQSVLNDSSLRKHIAEEVRKGKNAQELNQRADAMLKAIAADMRHGWLRFVDAIIDWAWNRIYDGIVVDPEGLEKVRQAARKGPVVVVPSHKSHVDYLVLSQIFFRDGMMPPHIAAGDNLNFWPLGLIFRRSGAFFLRRSFKGDKLYAAVFAAYVQRLLKEGHAVEFFIEGGRSRTGKLLAPKMGMLGMCVNPILDGAINDVSFIPISIGYEKIIEAKSYAKEMAGGKKKKEDMTSLVSSANLLRSKYGRVYVDFNEPISLRVFAASRGHSLPMPNDDQGKKYRRQLVTQLGHRIVYGINEVTRVTPTSLVALILLASTRRGMSEEELSQRSHRVVEFLREVGANLSSTLEEESDRLAALKEALGRFAHEGQLGINSAPDGANIYQLSDEGRTALDYYKNNILHFFVPYAIVAAAVIYHGGKDVAEEDIRKTARRMSSLLKNEFSFKVDTFEENFEETTELLVRRRTLEGKEGCWSITHKGDEEARELAGLLATFFESYRIMADFAEDLIDAPLPEKKLLQEAIAFARKQVLEGKTHRPEAATQISLKSALSVCVREKVLERIEAGQVTVTDDIARKAFLSELDQLIKSLS